MKRMMALWLAAVLCLSLAACGQQTAEPEKTENSQTETAQTPADTGETAQEEEPLEIEAKTDVPEELPEAEVPALTATPLALGDQIETAQFTMTFDTLELLPEYDIRLTENSSMSCVVEEGYQVLLVRGHITNTGTSVISDSAFYLTATVNGEYVVDGYDVRLLFVRNKYFEVDPYTDVDYVLYINVPDKLAELFETVTFEIGFKNDLGMLTTTYNVDGTETVDYENLYALTATLDGAAEESAASGTAAAATAAQTIALGETILGADYEFTLTNVTFSYEVLPPNTSSVYTSYPADSGKVYVDVSADVKNTMERNIRMDELFTVSACYDGKYQYPGFTVVGDDNQFIWASSYTAALPLETCKAHGLIECPVEVDTSGKSVVVTIEIDGVPYEYVLRA